MDEFEARYYAACDLKNWWTGNELPSHVQGLLDLMKSWSKRRGRRRPRPRTPSPNGQGTTKKT